MRRMLYLISESDPPADKNVFKEDFSIPEQINT